MNDILKQDIFFFVTTLAVILLTVLITILVIYIIKISRKVNYIADKAKDETDKLSVELADLRANIKSTGFKIKHLSKFFSGIVNRTKNK